MIDYDEVDFKFEDVHQPEQSTFKKLKPEEEKKPDDIKDRIKADKTKPVFLLENIKY